MEIDGRWYTEEQLADCQRLKLSYAEQQNTLTTHQLALQQQAQQRAYLQQLNSLGMSNQMYQQATQTSLNWMLQLNANTTYQQAAVKKVINEIVDQHEKYERVVDVIWNRMLSAVFTAKEIASETYWVLCYRQRLAEPTPIGSDGRKVMIPDYQYRNLYTG